MLELGHHSHAPSTKRKVTELRSCDYGPRPLLSLLICFIEAVLVRQEPSRGNSYIVGLLTGSSTRYQHISMNADLIILLSRRTTSWKLNV